MKHQFKIFFSFIFSFLFFSCAIETTTHFNKDYSGDVQMAINMSDVMGFMGSMAEENEGGSPLDSLFMAFESDSMKMAMDSINHALEESGISNFTMGQVDSTSIGINFDFANLEAISNTDFLRELQQKFGADEDMSMMDYSGGKVSLDGKWLTIDVGGGTYEEMLNEMMASEDGEEISKEEAEMSLSMMKGMMSEMFQIKQVYTFDRKVKEVVSPLEYESDKHSVTIEYDYGDLFEILEKEGEVLLKVRLK